MTEPQYRHDCDRCVFLGIHRGSWVGNEPEDYDLYFCANGRCASLDTFLARYSSEGPDYISMCRGVIPTLRESGHTTSDCPIMEAFERQKARES
jgi:hypothetical protein